MSSRRTFLLRSAAVVTSAALPELLHAERLGGPTFSEASLGAYTQGLLTEAHFTGLKGSLFMAFLEDNQVAYMRLTDVKSGSASAATKAPVPTARNTPQVKASAMQVSSFSLVFSTGWVRVPQGSYLLDHGTLGRFTVFLVEGLDEKGREACSATFAHL
jgi:hypothetical protein